MGQAAMRGRAPARRAAQSIGRVLRTGLAIAVVIFLYLIVLNRGAIL